MSMLDMSEFGEAAEYLRKSYTEQLKLQTIPFDGKTSGQLSAQPQGSFGHGSLCGASPSLPQCWYPWYCRCCRIVPITLEDRKMSEVGKVDFSLSLCLLRCEWNVCSSPPTLRDGGAEGPVAKPSPVLFHSGGVCSVPATLLYRAHHAWGFRAQLAPLGLTNKDSFAFSHHSLFTMI